MDYKTIKKLFLCAFLLCAIMQVSALQAGQPKRIVSMGPIATRAIVLLVEPQNIAGVTSYCRITPQVKDKTVIGTVLEPNLEQIITLRPDLVVASNFTRPEFVDKLRSIGIKVVIYNPEQDFDDLCREFLKLSKHLKAENKAKLIIKQATDKLYTVQEQVKDKPLVPAFVQIGADPLFTIMDNTFIADMLKRAGGKNIASNIRSGLYSSEQVLAADPDLIIMSNMGGMGENLPKFWQKYPFLKAVKNNRLYVLDEYETCSPTPESFAELTQKLSKLVHN